MTKPSTPTKADLYQMLAEAVRNTQPQPINSPPEPPVDVRPGPKRASRPRTQTAPKRKAKIKSERASVGRKGRRR